jgi:sigma-B regulation protein RsbU (phosphoserine phosphatase)
MLVLFTDGLTEAENGEGLQYGKERLAKCIAAQSRYSSAQQLLAAILADVKAFVSDAPASDDLTLLVVHWIGPSEGLSGR